MSKDDKEMRSNNEISSARESTSSVENVFEKENLFNRETGTNQEVDETFNKSVETENQEEEEKENKKEDDKNQDNSSQSSSGGAGAAGAGAGAAAAAAAIVLVIVLAVANIKASFNSLNVYGTYLDYEIPVTFEIAIEEDQTLENNYFDNYDTGLRLIVVNSSFQKIIELKTNTEDTSSNVATTLSEDGKTVIAQIIFKGKVEGLEEGTRYKVEIIGVNDSGGSTTYASEEVKTTGKITKIQGLTYICKCETEDKFFFTLNYVDENKYYSDFYYQLIDTTDDMVVMSGDMIDPSSEQYILGVFEFNGQHEYALEINFISSAESDYEKVGTTEEIGSLKVEYSASENNKTNIKITSKVNL